MSEIVIYETVGGIATITLNRPDRLNAMNEALIDDVLDRLEAAASDDDVRVVVLTGAGRGFCAGGDLGSVAEMDTKAPIEQKIGNLRRQHRSAELLHEMPKVTIAAVNGPCAGAGLSWACAADFRIAARSAVMRASFLSAGMTGDFGGTWSLTHLVGAAKARELYLFNEKVSADRAAELGLVNEVVDDDQLMDRVTEIASSFAAAPPLAVRGIKANLNDALTMPFSAALDAEAERHVRAALSEDCNEAATAFMEKRAPVFTGR